MNDLLERPRIFKPGDPVQWVETTGGKNSISFSTREGSFLRSFSDDLYQVKAKNNRKVLVPKPKLRHKNERGELTEAIFPEKA